MNARVEPSPWWNSTPIKVIGLIFGLAGFTFIVYSITAGFADSQLRRAESERDVWKARYDTLNSKTEGLFEPMLLYVDTLERSNDLMIAHGGKIQFRLERRFNSGVISDESYGTPFRIGLSFWNAIDSVSNDIELESGEQWIYTVKKDSFYITFEIIDRKRPKLIGKIHALKPLYKPASY